MFIDQSSAVCQYQLGFLVTSDKKKKAHVSEQLKGSSTQDVSASLCRFCGLASSARPLISGICGPKASASSTQNYIFLHSDHTGKDKHPFQHFQQPPEIHLTGRLGPRDLP